MEVKSVESIIWNMIKCPSFDSCVKTNWDDDSYVSEICEVFWCVSYTGSSEWLWEGGISDAACFDLPLWDVAHMECEQSLPVCVQSGVTWKVSVTRRSQTRGTKYGKSTPLSVTLSLALSLSSWHQTESSVSLPCCLGAAQKQENMSRKWSKVDWERPELHLFSQRLSIWVLIRKDANEILNGGRKSGKAMRGMSLTLWLPVHQWNC